MSIFSTTTTTTSANNGTNNMDDKAATSTIQFLTFPFRRRRKHYTINPPDDTYHVVYLGNVLTILAKGMYLLAFSFQSNTFFSSKSPFIMLIF
ncbi:unnamed protein product [Onchocerca flexuosa]|uniref:Transmembrane protein n=1 Tax=Onchocerca flexuosa TaxID=387005 RepID=A0A183HXM3_9BILA|nr:unnamed protein product [Onchocerca flexuosa]